MLKTYKFPIYSFPEGGAFDLQIPGVGSIPVLYKHLQSSLCPSLWNRSITCMWEGILQVDWIIKDGGQKVTMTNTNSRRTKVLINGYKLTFEGREAVATSANDVALIFTVEIDSLNN